MARPVNESEVLAELDRRMSGYGNGARAAREIGVVPDYLRSVKSGSQKISPKVATALGFELRWVKVSK